MIKLVWWFREHYSVISVCFSLHVHDEDNGKLARLSLQEQEHRKCILTASLQISLVLVSAKRGNICRVLLLGLHDEKAIDEFYFQSFQVLKCSGTRFLNANSTLLD